MLNNLRQRGSDEGGFTLIELLVVILIIGILAAIAIPTFLSQKSKATDVSAKELVQTARTAAETYATDNNGQYTGLNATTLKEYEKALTIKEGTTVPSAPYLEIGTVSPNSYTLTAIAADEDKYTIADEEGEIKRSCEVKSATANAHSGCTLTEGTKGTW